MDDIMSESIADMLELITTIMFCGFGMVFILGSFILLNSYEYTVIDKDKTEIEYNLVQDRFVMTPQQTYVTVLLQDATAPTNIEKIVVYSTNKDNTGALKFERNCADFTNNASQSGSIIKSLKDTVEYSKENESTGSFYKTPEMFHLELSDIYSTEGDSYRWIIHHSSNF